MPVATGNTDAYKFFPGVKEESKMNQTMPFETEPQIHQSLSKKSYIYKHDLFVKLQQTAHGCHDWIEAVNAVNALVNFYLRAKSQKLEGRLELVQYEESDFAVLKSKLKAVFLEKPQSPFNLENPLMSDIFNKITDILPRNKDDPDYDSVRKILEEHREEIFDAERQYSYNEFLNDVSDIIKVLDAFVQERPQWFEPNDELSITRKAIVRLFESGEYKFVLAFELLKQMESAGLDVSAINGTISKFDDKLESILFKNLFGFLGKQMRDIEFVITPLDQIYDTTPSTLGYCKKDTFFYVELRKHLSTLRILCGASEKDVDDIARSLEDFIDDMKNVYKGQLADFDELFELTQRNEDRFLKYGNSKDAYEVKEVGSKGFNVMDVYSEMKNLRLLKAIPNILFHIERFYQKRLVSKKNQTELTTQDMRVIIEELQIASIASKSEKIGHFLQNNFDCLKKQNQCSDEVAGKTIQLAQQQKDTGNDCVINQSQSASMTPQQKSRKVENPKTQNSVEKSKSEGVSCEVKESKKKKISPVPQNVTHEKESSRSEEQQGSESVPSNTPTLEATEQPTQTIQKTVKKSKPIKRTH